MSSNAVAQYERLTHDVSGAPINKHLPGDLAMWVFIVMELSVFAIFFIAFAVAQRFNESMFSLGRASLDGSVGLFCTLALIISSYLVALAVKAVKDGNNLQAKRLLFIALFSACFYLVLKLTEYGALIELGYGLSSNSFYTLYFLITGFHFLHVLLGMVILGYMGIKAQKNAYLPDDCAGFEAGASYWHMVDLVWIIVFFLIYIIH
ncbi:cytochrome c oxidase subunit 3 [Colwellia sp. KU-HH00111]|uniref:cytochrome c oxidase subunit 3 family protein n=1 Tax=Colwellia sp. KU-HH00111 TaxID=3127652 RepID=UPI0031056A25